MGQHAVRVYQPGGQIASVGARLAAHSHHLSVVRAYRDGGLNERRRPIVKSRKPACPKCGSLDVVPIEYGYPGPEMMAEAARGEIALGGCCVTDRDPRKRCEACGKKFDRPPARAARRRKPRSLPPRPRSA